MTNIKSGDYCKCENCGYQGRVYGKPTQKGVTSPWCPRCGRNDKLIKHKEDKNE